MNDRYLAPNLRMGGAPQSLPTPFRPCESGAQEGASHATKHDHDIEQINTRRRHLAELGLTQQATNSTCVTARRDGQPFMRGVNVNCPSLDAAACLGDRIAAAEADARVKAQDVAASRAAVDEIKRIAAIDFTPQVAAQLAAVLSKRVTDASWSHFPNAHDAIAYLDDAHDTLGAV